MKRAIICFIVAIILCSFPPQLLALPEGAVARLGNGGVDAVTFSPDGTMLAVASSIGIYLYDAKTLAEIDFLETNASMSSVAFNFDGTMLASGSYDKTIKLWDVKSRSLITTLSGHTDSVLSVCFSPDGSLLASGSWDGTIILWDMKPYIGQEPQQPNIVISDKNHNFNATPITTDSDWTFSIYNAGDSDLKISGIDSDNSAFTVTPMAFPQNITPGKTLDVAVSFTPTEEKTYTGILTIKSNDPDSPDMAISVEGNGIKNCDVNSDGVVNILDLVVVSKSFGKDVNNAKADVNKDGIVDITDLDIVLQHFGEIYK